MTDRPEAPTPRRLDKARSVGDVPHAPLLAAAVGLLLVPKLLESVLAASLRDIEQVLRRLPLVDEQALQSLGPMVAKTVVARVIPIALGLAAVAIVAAIVQGSVTFAPRKLTLEPHRLDVSAGLARLFDGARYWAVGRGALVLLIVTAVAWSTWYQLLSTASVVPSSTATMVPATSAMTRRLMWLAAGVGLPIAIIDVVVARQLWLARLRMTRAEVREEQRQAEGDPDLARHRKTLWRETLDQRSLDVLSSASVLVVGSMPLAGALRYAPEQQASNAAPIVVEKGRGALANRLWMEARRIGLPIVSNPELASALQAVAVGQPIPEALYAAAAEALRAAGIKGP